ncbi:conserved Plasmodium protein, unknown function [Plasmodium vinckei vinckei]|uniref:Uncharacterized protein n=1 Tax=Plasmodium vinckei vinckei TaxID=54757 RepID=A0A449BN74_PLAVN|nr:conserved Plasmodium protein, unknown function [Plasmodium vinckei vinckei]VEV54873.1 conserved Plasmodium protein, unknown function [Plasmodium vinckei vinckei]
MKTELNNRSNIQNNGIKRVPLKRIQVRRSIRDILTNDNPCIYIYNYTGKEIDVFPKTALDLKGKDMNNAGLFIDKIECDIKNDNDEKCNEESSANCLTNLKRMDSQENKLLNELNELLSKQDLTDEMKNNIKSLYIEIQEIYLEVKTDLKNNYPSAQDILKIYTKDEGSDKDKDYTWRCLCFYKLLNDQLSDIHISTITSYRLEYLKTIYKWYTKNKQLIFKPKIKNQTMREMSSAENDTNSTVEGKEEDEGENDEGEKEASDEGVNNKMEKCDEIDSPTKTLNKEMDKIREKDLSSLEQNMLNYDESNNALENYTFPNFILENNETEEREKKESYVDTEGMVHLSEREVKSGHNEIKSDDAINKINNKIETNQTDKLSEDGEFYHLNLNNIIIEEDHFSNKPKDNDKITELEDEIKKQKLLIKNKETEITDSLIGIRFKNIFGKFENLDSVTKQ